MPDLLVKLYELPPLTSVMEQMACQGVIIRRALPPEKHLISAWAEKHFRPAWAAECEVALSRLPVSCFIAVENEALLGFACHEATCKGFFGPTGVLKSARGRGVGKALLLAVLHDMRASGYNYAIIGGAGPTDFYAKVCGATVIENSTPGVYRGMLK